MRIFIAVCVLVSGIVAPAVGQLLYQIPSCVADCALLLMSWNVQFYPEDTNDEKAWFTQVLEQLDPAILLIQEIGNDDRVNVFTVTEAAYSQKSFTNL